MNLTIDTSFDVYSDTPAGRDPDSHSPTLRRYHRLLWNKPLPDGNGFAHSESSPEGHLRATCRHGEFFLSSDSIGHTYRYVKRLSRIVEAVPTEELDRFFSTCSTISAYIVFPSRKIDGRPTINGARGLNWKIRDRFDLTLECIRRHYQNQDSPLGETLERYRLFFKLFGSFRGYIDFFLLQDLVSADKTSVEFFLPFSDFNESPVPSSLDEYLSYKHRVTDFVMARNQRIAEYVPSGDALSADAKRPFQMVTLRTQNQIITET
jgi:hypothetical protein